MDPKPRRSKFDAEKQREFCAIVGVGSSREQAARYCGVTARTVRRTAIRDEEFAKRLRTAEMHREVSHLQNIVQAGRVYWRASAWALERLNPRDFLQRKLDTVTPEQVKDMLQRFAEILVEAIPDNTLRQQMLDRLDQGIKRLGKEERDVRAEPGR